MDLNLTTKAQEALSTAVRDAAAAGHAQVEPAHLLSALTHQGDTTTGPLLEASGSSPDTARQAAQAALAGLPTASGSSMGNPGLSRAMHAVVKGAQDAMSAMGDSFVSTDHLLLALARAGAGPGAAVAVAGTAAVSAAAKGIGAGTGVATGTAEQQRAKEPPSGPKTRRPPHAGGGDDGR